MGPHHIAHPASIRFTSSVLWPILAALCWLATLVGLLCLWAVQDHAVQYRADEAEVVYISDVGAAHKALFIPGTATTAVFYSLSLLSERWLRHVDRIPGTVHKRSRHFDLAAVITGIAAVLFLFLCSVFDAFTDPSVHWTCALLFVLLTAASAVCQTAEVRILARDHPDRAHLWRNVRIKMGVVACALVVAVGFGVTYGLCGGALRAGALGPQDGRATCWGVTSASAVCEWLVSFIYDAYLLTFVLDLWPASKTSPRYLRRQERHDASLRGPEPLIGGRPEPLTGGSPSSSFGNRAEMAQV